MDYKSFVEYAFQKLHERGWLTELIPSSITETDIAEFEQEYLIELPVILKLYLMSYKPSATDLVGVVYDDENKEIKIDTMDFYDLTDDISDWSESLECFREEFEDCETPLREEIYKNLFPIGYMDGWYCLDLSQSDGKDCPVVFLKYGGFGIIIVTQMEFYTVSASLPVFAHFWNGTFVVLWNRNMRR